MLTVISYRQTLRRFRAASRLSKLLAITSPDRVILIVAPEWRCRKVETALASATATGVPNSSTKGRAEVLRVGTVFPEAQLDGRIRLPDLVFQRLHKAVRRRPGNLSKEISSRCSIIPPKKMTADRPS